MNFILLPQRNQSLHNAVMRKYTDVGSWEWLMDVMDVALQQGMIWMS